MQQHSFLPMAPSRVQMGGISASLPTVQKRHILGKMNLHLLGSVGCMKQQGWDIWAAASHPNTWLTSPWLMNPHIAPRGILGEPGPLQEAFWCDIPSLKHSTHEVGQSAGSLHQQPRTGIVRSPGAPGLHHSHVPLQKEDAPGAAKAK